MNESRGKRNGNPSPGGIGNQPSRHTQVQIILEKSNGKTEPMNVVLGWSEDLLVDEVAALINMVKGQFYILFGSKQLGGKEILLDAGIRNGSRIRVNLRLLGGSQ